MVSAGFVGASPMDSLVAGIVDGRLVVSTVGAEFVVAGIVVALDDAAPAVELGKLAVLVVGTVEIFVGLLAVVDAPLEAVAAFAGSRLVEGLGTEAVAFSVASVTAVVVIVGFVVVVADSADCVVLWAD